MAGANAPFNNCGETEALSSRPRYHPGLYPDDGWAHLEDQDVYAEMPGALMGTQC